MRLQLASKSTYCLFCVVSVGFEVENVCGWFVKLRWRKWQKENSKNEKNLKKR